MPPALVSYAPGAYRQIVFEFHYVAGTLTL